jgi:hypothetical protein
MAAEWAAKDGAESTGPEVIASRKIVSGTVTVTRSAGAKNAFEYSGCAVGTAVRWTPWERAPLAVVVGLCQLTPVSLCCTNGGD